MTFKKYFLVYLLLFVQEATSQNPSNYAEIPSTPVNYSLPRNKNGLAEVFFMMSGRVKIDRWEKSADVWIKFDYKFGTAETLDPAFKFMYLFNGSFYGDQHIGKEIFNGIRVDRDLTEFEVIVSAKGQSRTMKIPRGEWKFFKVNDPQIDAKSVAVNFIKVTSIQFTNTRAIENRIMELINEYSKNNSKKMGSSVLYSDNEEKNQLKNEKLNITKKQNSNETIPFGNRKNNYESSNNTITQTEVNDKKNNSTQKNNNTSNKFEKLNGKYVTDKTDINNANGIIRNSNVDLTKVKDYFRDQEGNYFQKIDAGSFRKISKDEYENGLNSRRKNNSLSADEKKRKETIYLDSVKKVIAESSENYTKQTKNSHQQIERDMNLLSANYYAAKDLNNVKNELANSSKMKDTYQSVAELENDFRNKLSILSTSSEKLSSAQNRKLQSNYEYQFRDADANGKALGQAVVGIGSLINNMSAEKEAAKAKKELAEARAESLKKIELAKKENQLLLRRKLLNTFYDGGLPISSSRVQSNTVYLFAYSFDSFSIKKENPEIKITNVFPVSKTIDESWPYQATIRKELSQILKDEKVVVFGFFADENKINQMHESFINMSKQSGMKVQPVIYNGRPLRSNSIYSKKNIETDYFGNQIIKGNKRNIENKVESKSKIDFFGNPIKN